MEAIVSAFDLLVAVIVHGLSVLYWVGMAIAGTFLVMALVAAAAWARLRREMEYPETRTE